MFCPHCHNKIPDGSNICPLCYANLAGVSPGKEEEQGAQGKAEQGAQAKPRGKKKSSYAKGSRGSKRGADRTPMIIAFGLILILLVIIAMIVRSMFGAGGMPAMKATTVPTAPVNTPSSNFVVFGTTPQPSPVPVETTPEPQIEVTPTPSPVPEMSYTTLKKGSQGREVVTLQQALAQLGFLNGATDGNFGTGTETAVKNFQAANGLEADGIAGRMTLEALYSQSSVTPMPEVTAAPGDILNLPG